MNRKLNIDDLKEMVKDCVYEEENLVCMSSEHYYKLIKRMGRLNKKIEQYENPEDMTLMFMWCDEKAKDEIKRLHSIIKEVREYIENNTEEKKSWLNGIPDYRVFKGDTKDLLEILDKENKGE